MIIVYICALISILCVFLLYKLGIYLKNLNNAVDVYSRINFDRFLFSRESENIKPGDLIFSIAGVFSNVQMFSPEIYKHVAIVIKYNDELYCAESTEATILGKDKDVLIAGENIVVYPLKNRIKYNLSLLYITQLNKDLTYEQSRLLTEKIMSIRHKKYPSTLSLVLQFIVGIPSKDNLYCYNLVYKLLKYIDIIEQSKKRNSREVSKFITHIDEHELKNGYKYSKFRQLVYDIID
jgi:hypothetical protein